MRFSSTFRFILAVFAVYRTTRMIQKEDGPAGIFKSIRLATEDKDGAFWENVKDVLE